jgi:hypothetical protein
VLAAVESLASHGTTIVSVTILHADLIDPRVSERALAAGFSNEPIGTHTGKTMMLAELRLLLAAAPGEVGFDAYRRAAVDGNALEKSTATNRSNTLKYLKQLYGLRPDIPVFAALRELWPAEHADQPMLAALCATARDVVFRITTGVVLDTPIGAAVPATELTARIASAYPSRYSPSTLRNFGQNIASSWTHAGLLEGVRAKRRRRPVVHTPAAVYALYLGHLEGVAGPALFATRWARILDRTEADMRDFADSASRSGWLEYRSSGGMTEIGFRHLDSVTGWSAT